MTDRSNFKKDNRNNLGEQQKHFKIVGACEKACITEERLMTKLMKRIRRPAARYLKHNNWKPRYSTERDH